MVIILNFSLKYTIRNIINNEINVKLFFFLI